MANDRNQCDKFENCNERRHVNVENSVENKYDKHEKPVENEFDRLYNCVRNRFEKLGILLNLKGLMSLMGTYMTILIMVTRTDQASLRINLRTYRPSLRIVI